jgi:triosephosphate isomerase
MRQALVAGNWKMHGTRESVRALTESLLAGIDSVGGGEVAVCPPNVFLHLVGDLIAGSPLALGAQNVCDHDDGAFTGETSVGMLSDCGCRYVIVGHSERRALYAESDQLVADKFRATQAASLTPILCLGETRDEREAGHTRDVVERQLKAVIDTTGVDAFADAVVAYEPVWAIGTGLTATPAQANEVHAFVRQCIAAESATTAKRLRILYGGSVKADNAPALFGQPDIDGGLIGGAALKADDFLNICRASG